MAFLLIAVITVRPFFILSSQGRGIDYQDCGPKFSFGPNIPKGSM